MYCNDEKVEQLELRSEVRHMVPPELPIMRSITYRSAITTTQTAETCWPNHELTRSR